MNIQSTIKYNSDLQTVFQNLTGDIYAGQAIHQGLESNLLKHYNLYISRTKNNTVISTIPKNLIKPVKSIELKVTKKRRPRLTPAQKRGYQLIKDRMETAKSDMIHHIEVLIKSGEIHYREFINDPSVYYDSQIMGVYYNNYIIRKAVVRYFEREFIPF